VTPRLGRRLACVALALVSVTACADDGAPSASTTTTEEPGTIVPADPVLEEMLLTEADLPDGFAATSSVDDTITSFCVGQDATAGLSASARASTGFSRTPAGASVIELVFRFDDDGAARFVTQAGELLRTCNEIPDASGLAFTYEPVSPGVASPIEAADSARSGYGTSVGSGNLTMQIAVVQVGAIGALVAVLGVDTPRAASDELAEAVFGAAVARLLG
jgi:hypothetical protein